MLPQALKERVFALLDSVQPESRYKVLVIDQRAKQLLDLFVDRAELLSRQVANVLILDEQRPTESYLEAVYFVEQSSYSMGCIQADFVRVPRRYAAAHVFFLPRLRASPTELQRFQNSAIKPHLKRAEPAPFAFYALEHRIFSFGQIRANSVLYSEACRDIALQFVDMTGRQLANVCETLRINPYVRFSARWQMTRANGFPMLVAQAATQHIEAARTKYMTPALDSEPRPTLLILDRTVDMSAPLRHEFGFQAMALDVLGKQFAPPNTLREFTAHDSKEVQMLSENDKVWNDLRHKHIVVVTEQLNTRIRELRATNPHLADPKTDVSVGDVRNMLATLPEFMKEREGVALSLDMAMECMAKVESLQLKELAEFEQAATLGTIAENAEGPAEIARFSGKFEGWLADSLVTVLAHRSADRDIKIRALALYVLHRGGLRNADYTRLQRHARLADADLATVQALSYLGAPMTYQGASVEKTPPPLTKEHTHQPLLFTRVQTGLQTTVEQLIAGTLTQGDYPYANDAPDSTQEALNVATSLRNPRQRATWAQSVTSSSSSRDEKPQKLVIVFVIGGITASEAQAAYTVSENSSFSVLLGGHDLLTPTKYVDFLSTIHATREELHLEEDQPDKPVPAFLNASDRENQRTNASANARQATNTRQAASAPRPSNTVPVSAGLHQGGRIPSKPSRAPTSSQSSSARSSPSASSPPPVTTTVARNSPDPMIAPTTYLGPATGEHKEKKDMKHRIKGAFKLKR